MQWVEEPAMFGYHKRQRQHLHKNNRKAWQEIHSHRWCEVSVSLATETDFPEKIFQENFSLSQSVLLYCEQCSEKNTATDRQHIKDYFNVVLLGKSRKHSKLSSFVLIRPEINKIGYWVI